MNSAIFKLVSIFAGTLLLAVLIGASGQVHAKRAQKGIDNLMVEISDSMLTLLPMIHEKEVDRGKLSEEVNQLRDLLGRGEAHFEAASIGSQITYGMIKEQVELAAGLAADENIYSVKAVLAESFQLCASCHSQDRRAKRAFGVSRVKLLDEFLAAEYSYLTRDYESALTSYQNYLDDVNSDYHKRSLALERVLSILLEIYEDPALARDTFKALLSRVSPLSGEQYRLKEWIVVLDRIAQAPEDIQSPTHARSIIDMDHFLKSEWPVIQTALGLNEQQIYWMLTRASLNRMLQKHPKSKEVPRLLYWLAVSDRSLHYRFFESLSRRYLEQCIRQYPGHSYAQECFNEYELLMIVSFSGSGGTQLPLEVRTSINELRQIVYGEQQ